MIEHPIIFSAPMVRAILADQKTQTRRIVNPQPNGEAWSMNHGNRLYVYSEGQRDNGMPCPYGGFGERLWVRETWSPDHAAFYPHFPTVYRADSPLLESDIVNGQVLSPEAKRSFPFRWRPSIHMPRKCSRITLEITGVRVERLQAISEEDAKAEGPTRNGHLVGFPVQQWEATQSCRDAFQQLWGSINGKGSWAANPWVWVVSFRREKP